MKKIITFLAVFLLFTCHVQTYAQQSENAKKTFIGKGLKEIDKVATKTWKDILKLFRGKKGVMLFPYKIGTNKELKCQNIENHGHKQCRKYRKVQRCN